MDSDDEDWNDVGTSVAVPNGATESDEEDWNDVGTSVVQLSQQVADCTPVPVEPLPLDHYKSRKEKIAETLAMFWDGGPVYLSAFARGRVASIPNTLKQRLFASALLVHRALRSLVSKLLGSAVARCHQRGPDHDGSTAAVYVRRRKYDEAQQLVQVKVPEGRPSPEAHHAVELRDRLGHAEFVTAKHKIMVVELAWGLVMRKLSPRGSSYLTLLGRLASRLYSIDKNNGETVNHVLNDCTFDCESDVVDGVERVINIHCHDEGAPNGRCERFRSQNSKPHETSLELLCLAHKKAQCNGEVNRTLKPIDGKLIRLQLSLQGWMKQEVISCAKVVLHERLVIIPLESLDHGALEYMTAVLDLCLSGTTATSRYRRYVVSVLFYGEWRRHDEIRIVDKFGMGRSRLLDMLCSIGLQCIMPRKSWPVLQRNNWTGSDQCLDTVLLPTLVFGLFPSAYLQASGKAHVAQSRPLLPLRQESSNSDSYDHLYTEDDADRRNLTTSWLIVDNFASDLIIFRILMSASMPWLLRQLRSTSVREERVQQLRLLESGVRDYQMRVQYDGKDNRRLMQEVSDFIFNDSAFRLVHKPTELEQLHAYQSAARLGAAAYDLVIVRCRKPPYSTAAGLKYPHILSRLASECPGMHDEYTASFVKHYGAGLKGAGAQAELTVVNLLGDTDTSSTEGLHSVQCKLAKTSQTHKVRLDFISAQKTCTHEQKTGLWCLAETHQQVRVVADDAAADARPKVVSRGGGPWRAFLHVNGRGRQITAALLNEFSLLYGALTASERAYYVHLGRVATKCRRFGCKSFGCPIEGLPAQKRARWNGGFNPRGSQFLTYETDASVGDAALEDPARLQLGGCNRFIREARDVLQRERSIKLADQVKEEELMKKAQESSGAGNVRATSEALAWRLMGASSECEKGGPFQQHQSQGKSTVVTYHESKERVVDVACNLAESCFIEKAAQEWEDMHKQIRFCQCQPLGTPPNNRSMCFDAERCLCRGDDGKLLRLLRLRYQQADRTLKRDLTTERYKQLVSEKPFLVVLLELKDIVDAGASVPDSGSAPLRQLWLHVARTKEHPQFSAIFVTLSRLPTDDHGVLIGVKPNRAASGWSEWLTLWEVLISMLPLDKHISLTFYQ